MSEKNRQLALQGLSCLRGDNLERARLAFRGMTPKQMQEQHGESGWTRAEILAGYEQHVADVEAAMEWVRNAK